MTPETRNPPLPPPPPPLLTATTACDVHPAETVTGFCASCLRERLAGLDASSAAAAAAPGARKSSSIRRSYFSRVSGSAAGSGSHLRSELRRCKSSSACRPLAASVFEPQRHSCDARGRSTLWSLFHQDDRERVRGGAAHDSFLPSSAAAASLIAREIEAGRLDLGFPPPCVPEITREEEEEEEAGGDFTAADPVLASKAAAAGEEMEMAQLKPIRTHIDIESRSKKPPPKDLREIAGSFWTAASVFSKKWQEWRRKQKLKKQDSKAAKAAIASEKPTWQHHHQRRRFRDTQSEVAADAFGRRSCDADPRFSLDAVRVSFDHLRHSFDEPRASWDGYFIGGRSVSSRLPSMLSVVEDAPSLPVWRSDCVIPVEEDAGIPGGSTQTRDYYLDSSSSRKRRSFESSNSIHKVMVDVADSKPTGNANAKVSPAGSTEFYHCHHGRSSLDRDLWHLRSNSQRDHISESFESAFQDSRRAMPAKKPRGWMKKTWNIWGLIHKRGSSRGGAPNVARRSYSESWPQLMLRSNSSVSARSSFSGIGGLGSMRRSSVEINGHGMSRRGELMLERKRSCRYSPSRVDNGMLRFFSTPMQSSRSNWRNGGASGNGRPISSLSHMPGA